jgi:hypothetical protein
MPQVDIAGQDSAYRRGMVLGLTMAEIMTLIVFALLLVVGSVLIVSDEEKRGLEITVKALQAEIEAATAGLAVDHQTPEDIFRELILAKKQAEALPGLRAKIADLEEKLKQDSRLTEAVKKLGDVNDPKHAEDLAAAIELSALITQLQQAGDIKLDKPGLLALLNRAKLAGDVAANLRGQIVHLEAAAKASGKGTEFPPCWADEQTGRPEFIFDVSVTSLGIIVRDNAIPHRAAEQALLPIAGIEFGRNISNAAFAAETRPLLDWSSRQDPVCRFFVRLYDMTGPTEKATFKAGFRTVGSSFYNLLLDASPNAPQ